MALELSKVKSLLQDHLQEGLLIVVGTGLAIAESIPGMGPLAERLKSVFLQRRRLELADLYCAGGASASGGDEPFTNFGANAIEKLFSEGEKKDILTLIKRACCVNL